MKKKILLIFLFISVFSQAQVFQENFNSGLPTTWTISDNNVGTGQTWTGSPAGLGNNATISAMVANETGSTAVPVQDWLITPQIDLTGIINPQLVFFGKTTPAGPNRNSILKIMISTTGTDQDDFSPIETFTETYAGALNPISPNTSFNQKTLDLIGYTDEEIYIAFVMENTGLGKTWFIDDVALFDQCLDVTNIQIGSVTLTTGTITWENPGNAASFQIELVTGTNLPTGIATHTSNTNSITLPLTFGVNYKVYVRAICTGNTSNWIISDQFTPQVPGTACYSAINVTSLPYTHSDTTANYGDDYNGSAGGTGCGVTGAYLNGDDVVYALTATEDMLINIEMIPDGTYSGVFVYDSCANIGVSCVAGVANSTASTRFINELSLTAGTTYYIVISTRPQPQSVQYTLNIQRVYCAQPINLSATNFTQNSAQLSWNNGTGSTATAWQIFVQNLDAGLPVTTGTNVNSSTPTATLLQTGAPLAPSSMYEYYVRALCPDGNYSPWSGPYLFNTLCAPFNLPFSEGFNSNSTTELCWSVINNNADTRLWDLNYTGTPFEGNESASINAFASGAATNDDYLVTPVFNFNGQYRLRYKYKVGNITNPQNFSVKMSQNGGVAPSDFTTILVADTGYTNEAYKEKIVYLPNFVGTGAISWHVQSNLASRINIDDVIIESIPSCPEPYDIVNTESSSVSINVDWQQFGTVNSWDVILVPAGTPFTGDTTGLTVYPTTTKPFQISGLASGTRFDVYVRSNCSGTNQSTWSLAGQAATKVSNDECINAIQAPVNVGTDCIDSFDVNFLGATNSNDGTNCTGTSTNDVWYQFTATSSTHVLSVNNIQGNPTTIYSVLYSGNCAGGLLLVECDTFNFGTTANTYNNLIVGNTYYLKFYTNTQPATTSFTACILKLLPPITTSNTAYTVPELVTDVLINNPCAEVTNITWSTGSNASGLMGIGYFAKNGSSFSYDDGIILSTGSIKLAPGPKGLSTQGETASNWGSDPDLAAVLATQGLNGSLNNATVLEFDFTAITPQMSFNFLFASEEYGTFQCGYSDAFAFLLTDLSTGITTNLAVIPNTTIPVAVTTIRDQAYNPGCLSANIAYFDSYYNGTDGASLGAPINFRGHTVPMIAQSVVVPGTTYHIKLVIADYNDSGVDSAVFIEGGSFQLGEVDLGSDLTVEENNALCSEQSYTLDSGVDLDQYTIEWLKDGVVMPGENSPILIVTESGTYTIEATYIGSECAISDSVLIEIYPFFLDDFNDPELIKVCSNEDRNVDLTSNEAIMLNGLTATDFDFEYYPTATDLDNNSMK